MTARQSLTKIQERTSAIEASLAQGRRPAEVKDDVATLTQILDESLKGVADIVPNTADALFTLGPKLKEARKACDKLSAAIALGLSPDKAFQEFRLALAEVRWVIDMLDVTAAEEPADTREPPRAVVLTPLDAPGTRVSDTVERALASAGVMTYGSDRTRAVDIVADLMRSIERADFVVADLSRLNPNVMLELGYAMGKGVPMLLLVSKDSRSAIPTAFMGMFYFVYDPSNMRSLSEHIKRSAAEITLQRVQNGRG